MEDADGYMSIDPGRREPFKTPPAPKDTKGRNCNLPWWKIGFGIAVAGNIVLGIVLILLTLPGSQIASEARLPHNEIQSCLRKCVPCNTAKKSTIANLTLDPKTAHPQLYVSADLKSVKWKDMKQEVNSSPFRYNVLASVLSHQSFTSGRNCWEVELVERGEWWGVGVVRASANRNGPIVLNPGGGYWGVQLIDGQYQSITEPRTNLSLCHRPSRIRVYLDYSEGLVEFFDGDTSAQIFAFPKVKFAGEPIYAWFLIYGWNGELMVHP
ncbi:butyrophilin subfamily 1 member A1-like [Elgaria multicarinata webbii]|uniref:butyrophilin subfamily 1 member A1-like n=1 Tax=Elgaria multicarinata webbii TaxID=159646 RepID=UPI002FCD3B8A